MAHSPEASDSEWEKVDAEEVKASTEQAPSAPTATLTMAVGSSEQDEVRSEDNFEIVECPSAGDASCESDGEAESSDHGDGDGSQEEPHSPTPASEDSDHPLRPVEKSGSDHSDGSSTTADEGRAHPADEEPSFAGYRCGGCDCLVFKENDIESSQYHAQTSPGYLLNQAYNFEVIGETETVKYTTGVYEIQHINCKRCRKPWGITYTDAHEHRNNGKVGKFLIGCDRLVLPKGVVHPLMVEH